MAKNFIKYLTKIRKEQESSRNLHKFSVYNKIEYLLRNGYSLRISANINDRKCNGCLTLMSSDTSIDGVEEVDVEVLFAPKSRLKKYLQENITCQAIIYYDHEKRIFIGNILKSITEGPYCEFLGYEEVLEESIVGNSFSVCFKSLEQYFEIKKNNSNSTKKILKFPQQ